MEKLIHLTLHHTFDEDLWIEEQTWASFGYVKGRKIASYVVFFLKKLRSCSTSCLLVVLLSTSKIRNAYLSFMKDSMACIDHTGHENGECWREHSGTTGWQKNLKTWFYMRVLTKILKDLAEIIFCLTFQYRKKKWKGRITIICKHKHIWRNVLILQTFLISRFCKKGWFTWAHRKIWLFEMNAITFN